MIHTGVLQAHRIEHAARALRDAGRGIAEARLPGGSLEGEGSQAVDVVELGKLAAVTEGAACGNHRIVQLNPAEVHAGIYHTISSFVSTGPSLQMRLLPYFVSQVQPMHAPKPQPMRSSKLYSPEVAARLYTAFSIGSGPQA